MSLQDYINNALSQTCMTVTIYSIDEVCERPSIFLSSKDAKYGYSFAVNTFKFEKKDEYIDNFIALLLKAYNENPDAIGSAAYASATVLSYVFIHDFVACKDNFVSYAKEAGLIDKSYHTPREGWIHRYEGESSPVLFLNGWHKAVSRHNYFEWVPVSVL